MSSPRNDDFRTLGGVISLSPLVQVALLLTLAVVLATQARAWINPGGTGGPAPDKRQQKIFVIGPKGGSVEDLQSLVNDGWRVTHLANAGATNVVTPVTRYGLLMENGTSKEQEFIFFTAGEGQQ